MGKPFKIHARSLDPVFQAHSSQVRAGKYWFCEVCGVVGGLHMEDSLWTSDCLISSGSSCRKILVLLLLTWCLQRAFCYRILKMVMAWNRCHGSAWLTGMQHARSWALLYVCHVCAYSILMPLPEVGTAIVLTSQMWKLRPREVGEQVQAHRLVSGGTGTWPRGLWQDPVSVSMPCRLQCLVWVGDPGGVWGEGCARS